MKILEIITESKTQKAEAPKPRNFVAKNAMKTTSGAGAHKDKKKAQKQGDVKHKGKVMAEGTGPNISTLDAVFNEHDFYRLENIWPALEAGDKEEALRQINHYLRKGKNRAWWGDLQAMDIKIDPSDVENSRVMWSKPIKQGVAEGPDDTAYGRHQRYFPKGDVYNSKGKKIGVWNNGLILDPTIEKRWEDENGYEWVDEIKRLASDYIAQGRWTVKPAQGVAEGRIDEKAKSKAQQKFMGMVYAAKKGEKPASPEVAKAASGMSKKSAKDYAQTKHKGKPEHVKEDGEGGASAGSTTSAMVGVGAVYKNKRAKKQKPGTNALDMKGVNLLTGGSIKR